MTKSELLLILQSDMIDAIDIFLIEQIDGTGIDHAFRIQAGTVIIDGLLRTSRCTLPQIISFFLLLSVSPHCPTVSILSYTAP